MIISMTACNENSGSSSCNGHHETFINDLVFIFFSQHKCDDLKTNNGVFSSLPKYNMFIAMVIFNYLKKSSM